MFNFNFKKAYTSKSADPPEMEEVLKLMLKNREKY